MMMMMAMMVTMMMVMVIAVCQSLSYDHPSCHSRQSSSNADLSERVIMSPNLSVPTLGRSSLTTTVGCLAGLTTTCSWT